VSATASFPALGTTAVVCVAEPGRLVHARTELVRELDRIDGACSRFREDSELSRLNRNAGSWTAVGPLLLEALRIALDVARATDGLVDPTVGRTLRAAGYDRTFRLVCRRDGETFRARFAPVPGWGRVQLDEERAAARVPRGAELDLGATAKAHAADRAARACSEAAGCGVLVALGGDVSVAGGAPAGGWPVRVADDHAAPLSSDGPVVGVSAGGLATSGTTVRRWRSGATELHHVIDPRTGHPAATPWRTVTVAAASCVDANAASTAALVLAEEAPHWLAERRLPARLVTATGSEICVGGWPEEPAA
jgi:thiamine biosynthesis lipoprotein